ncbi:MAG: immune inhibitor A, partial [Thermoanaerobaculia bacterium]|nr:immune inhibitor A [Thermoanaerobaculia bacterium]
ACATPTPITVGGCAGAPTAAAANLVATPEDRGAALTWDPVAGATRYKVYRTEGVFGCDFGKTVIGETTGTSFSDVSGLMNGREYFYSVMAFGASDQCHGAMTSCASATPVPGPNMVADSTSTTTTVAGGDGDLFFDNCEALDISFDVNNVGTGALTNLDIVSVTSGSHPNVIVTTPLPHRFRNSLAACGVAPAQVRVSGSGMSHNDTVELDIEFTAAELAGATRNIHVSVPFVESDFSAPIASQMFSFESDNQGWTVTSGTFNRASGAPINASNGSFRLDSSTLLPDQCDRMASPVIVPSATTTLSLFNNFETEDDGGVGAWYDRANVAVLEGDGTRNQVEPSSGRLYNAVPGAPYSGCNDTNGWAGNFPTWAQSSFNAAALGSAGHAGSPIQIEVTYSTDPALELRGFSFDEVTLTNFQVQIPDAGANCSVGGIFSDGFESGDTSAW